MFSVAGENALLWSRNGDLTRQAAQLIGILADAEVYGLRSEDYAKDRLRGCIDSWPEFDRILSAARGFITRKP